MRIALVIAVASSLLGGAHYYVWARLVRDTMLPEPWSTIGKILLICLFLMIPLSFILYRGFSLALGRTVMWPVYIWMGLLFLVLVLLAGVDLARLLLHVGLRLAGPGLPVDPERRLFFARVLGSSVAAAAAGLGGVAMRSALGQVRVRELSVELARLPRALDGMTLVQLTDLHIGPTIGRAWVEEIVRQVNALDADAVVITGDLVDGSVEQLREAVAPFAGLRARHGVFFVTGNHEYYAGVEEWLAELGRIGMRVLRNERVSLGNGEASFDLAGVDDWNASGFGRGHGPDLQRALDGRDPSRELVLLAHQPRAIFEASRLGVGLQLSGHTHGGQIWPWNYMVRLQQPYVAGLAKHGATQIYVSNGTGYWGPPMRLGAPAEITRVVLRAAG